MKPRSRIKPSRHKGGGKSAAAKKRNPRSSSHGGGDPFFESDPKRRRRAAADEDLESLPSDDDDVYGGAGDEAEPEAPEETADEVRVRLNREHLDRIKEAARKQMEEEEGDGDGDEDREEKEGRRDSLVAEILQRNQLEESGRALRSMASRVLKPEPIEKFRLLVKHRKSVTAVALGEDDRRGFSASKDGTILHWDVESGKKEKYLWPSEDVLISHYAKATQNLSKKRSNNTLALAVSSDGRYLVSGGLDRHIHLWDTRTRGHIQAFHGHRGPVSCLAFRQRTPQLFSGSFDRTIKLWNVEDRTHMDSLFGHQSEILTIDCLHKERPLTVGRDRTMRLWTITEGKHAKFEAAASSFECSCFISDNDILSGSDDGSIKFWTTKSRKPTHIVKNAHTPLLPEENMGIIPNGGQTENDVCITGSYSAAQSWVSSVAVCRGSDLAASGAANGVVRLWAIESNEKSIRPLCSFPLVGFVNSLAFAKSGRFLLAGVGQEHRLGTWERVRTAENGVAIHSIKLKEDRKHSL